jgi:hypothetical protein
MVELWVKCEHGSLVRHGVVPEGTRSGEYVPAHRLVWCDGPHQATLDEAYKALGLDKGRQDDG